jgi:hypothetical protein
MDGSVIAHLRPEALAELCALLSIETAHNRQTVNELKAAGQDKAIFDLSIANFELTIAAKRCAELLYTKVDMDTAIDMLVTAGVIAEIIIES